MAVSKESVREGSKVLVKLPGEFEQTAVVVQFDRDEDSGERIYIIQFDADPADQRWASLNQIRKVLA